MMNMLSYTGLKDAGYCGYYLPRGTEKVLQFGEGNFLRAFVDYWFDLANEKAGWGGKCVLVQPIAQGLAEAINAQEGLYTLYLRGRENGVQVDRRRVISSVSRCLNPYTEQDFQALMEVAESAELEYIISNTTEAGIVYDPSCQQSDRPAASFPGKLTQVLYHRYQAGRGGLVILPCELIDNNGAELFRCVLAYAAQWELGEAFVRWLEEACTFCSTLVDRIVPGRISDSGEVAALEAQNGYRDHLAVVGEVFGVWNIQGPEWLSQALPFERAGANCPVVPDVVPYKMRKVRILNGAHTGTVLGAWLAGYDIVRDCMGDAVIRGFMNNMLYSEVIPTLPLPREDLMGFAAAVEDRFDNPFIDHGLLSISLNSTSKWRVRNLPSLLERQAQTGKLPPCLTAGLAALIAFFSQDIQELTGEGLVCRRPNGDRYTAVDDRWVLEFYHHHRQDTPDALTKAVLGNVRMWGQDLTQVPGLLVRTAADLALLREEGALALYARCVEESEG